MTAEIIGLTGFALMLAMMFAGVPIALAMGLVGLIGFALLVNPGAALQLSGLSVSSVFQDYTFAVIPLFLLMGEFADISRIMRDAYQAANKALSGVRGGLAMASIVGAAAFSAVSGLSLACTVLMSRVALLRLLELGYRPSLSAGAMAAGGTLGNLVPPGVLLVIYALLSGTSVGELMVAAILPGLLLTLMYVGQIYVQCVIDPTAGPAGPGSGYARSWSRSSGRRR